LVLIVISLTLSPSAAISNKLLLFFGIVAPVADGENGAFHNPFTYYIQNWREGEEGKQETRIFFSEEKKTIKKTPPVPWP